MTFKELIDSYNEQLLAKEARMNEIKNELPSLTDVAEIDKRKAEVSNLVSERNDLTTKRDEAIMQMQKELEEGKKKLPERKENFRKMNRRESQNLLIGLALRGKKPTDEQIRALDVSLTTTANDFVKATASADGVNNGGVFIPTKILYDLLKEEDKLTPIMDDIAPTYVPGLTEYPIRVSRTEAQKKLEGKKVNDTQWEFIKLKLETGTLQSQLPVTDELYNMTDYALGDYIIQRLEKDLVLDWSKQIIYGDGTDMIKGLTTGLTPKKYAKKDALEAIENAVMGLSESYIAGAKLYIARDLFYSISFKKSDDGKYLINPINNPGGISSFTNIPVMVDHTLKPGEFVLGNVSEYFRLNMLQSMHFETARDALAGITRYVVRQSASGAPYDKAFVYYQHDASLDN